MPSYPFELVKIDTITPSEEICNDSLDSLKKKIINDNYWTDPIVIDKESRIIMNGNHRFNAAKELGFTFIPTVIISYESDDVEVRNYKKNDIFYDVFKILNIVKNGKLLPFKETKHIFKREIPKIKVSLSSLKGINVKQIGGL